MKFSGKRKIILVTFIVLLGICWIVASLHVRAGMVNASYRGLICIDAGHGGFDPGAVGHHIDVGEDVINLAVAKELKAEFESRGFAVLMTRENENALAGTKAADMQMRRDIIRESSADIMISIHMNANGDSSVSGPIAYFYPDSDEGQLFAQSVQDELNKQLKPARDKKINCDKYFVLRAGSMPSIIIELGFITNADDAWRIQQPEYQEKAVKAIADGTEAFLIAKEKLQTDAPAGEAEPTLPIATSAPTPGGCPCATPCACSPCRCASGCDCTPPCRCSDCICGTEAAKPETD